MKKTAAPAGGNGFARPGPQGTPKWALSAHPNCSAREVAVHVEHVAFRVDVEVPNNDEGPPYKISLPCAPFRRDDANVIAENVIAQGLL